MSTLDVLLERKEEIKAVLEKYGASNLSVYGSVARREDTENSDINFLVDLGPRTTLHERVLLIEDLQTDITALLGKQSNINDFCIGTMRDRANAEAVLIC